MSPERASCQEGRQIVARNDKQNWVVTGQDRDDAYMGILIGILLVVGGFAGLVAWGFSWIGVAAIALGALAFFGSTSRLSGRI